MGRDSLAGLVHVVEKTRGAVGILIAAQKMCFCLALASRANCCLVELCALEGTKRGVVGCLGPLAGETFSQA